MESGGLQTVALNANRRAMEHLRMGRYEVALKLLLQAKKLLSNTKQPKLLAITLNNLGCYYKRTKNNVMALKHLSAALDLESLPPINITNLAGTHLNICAIRSQMGKHETALGEAMNALKVLSEASESSPNTTSTLAIAYHNAGVELEYLNQLDQAINMFRTGWEAVHLELGETHPLVLSLWKSGESVDSRRRKHFRGRSTEATGRRTAKGYPNSALNFSGAISSSASHTDSRRRTKLNFSPMGDYLQMKTMRMTSQTPDITKGRKMSASPTPQEEINQDTRQNNLKTQKLKERKRMAITRTVSPAPPPLKPGDFHRTAHGYNRNLEERVERLDSQLHSLQEQMASFYAGRLSEPVINSAPKRSVSRASNPSNKRASRPHAFLPSPEINADLSRVLQGFLFRKQCKRRTKAAVRLQAFIRKRQCFSLFKNIRAAVVFIQKEWRRRRICH